MTADTAQTNEITAADIDSIRAKVLDAIDNRDKRLAAFHPDQAEDETDRAYRRKNWEEIERAENKIMLNRIEVLFAPLFDAATYNITERTASILFASLHHPMSGTRQIANWNRDEPPPIVRKAVAQTRNISLKTRERGRKRIRDKE